MTKKILVAVLAVLWWGWLSNPVQAANMDELYRHYQAIETNNWQRLEDIKAALGNPTFEGNDGSHYYIYEPLPKAIIASDRVRVNTDGYYHTHVPSRAIVLPGYRVTIRLNYQKIDDLKESSSWKNFHDVRAALGEPNYIGHDQTDTYYVYYSLANSFRVGEQLLVNAPGREGSNYVPTNDVVSKGQSATIRFKKNTPDNGHTSERVKVSALGDDEALKNIARHRQLGILEHGGRVFTPEKEIEIDTNQAVFDTPWGRLYQGSVVPSGRQVTLWRQ